MNGIQKTIWLAFGSAVADTLVWEDDFDTLDFSKWQHEITMGGGGNWEFEMYWNNRTNSFVEDGVLHLQPTLTSEAIGLDVMKHGSYSLWGASPADLCTGNAFYGCERDAAASGSYINPITSARLRSVHSMNTKYGKVEVKAQLPKGDWLWPAIWMRPVHGEYGTWPASGEIDIVESRGNDASCSAGGNDSFGSTLHWGPAWDQNGWEQTHAEYKHTASLSDAMHTYGLIWTEDRIQTYFETPDNIILDVDTSTQSFWEKGDFEGLNPWRNEPNNAPFNREFYLVMNVAVGGTNAYFPDGQCGKPWTNGPTAVNDFWDSWGTWYPTWNYPESNDAAMKIDSVKVWSLDSDPFLTQ